MAFFSRHFVLAALCSASLASIAVTAMAHEDMAAAEQPAAAPHDGYAYDDLIGDAQKKGFKLTREEFQALMEKAHEKADALEEKRMKNSQAVLDVAPLGGRAVALEVVDTQPLVKGQESHVTLRMTYEDNGEAVTIDRLQTFHTKPIHMMINEPQLNDYTHAHPTPTDKDGEYEFVFTPHTDCSYRAWIDMYPYDGIEQEIMVDLNGTKDCTDLPVEETVNSSAEEGGLKYVMSMNTKELAKDQDTMLSFNITDKNGEGFTGLQPVMGAYAHLVGFRGDFGGLTHIHPMGAEPMNEDDRGGPGLSFHLRPKEAGYMRFFLQVLIDGKMHFIPFGVNVAEKGQFSGESLRQVMDRMKQDEEGEKR